MPFHIPMNVPIGVTNVATAKGTVWKFVSCEGCQERYAYLMKLEATGEQLDMVRHLKEKAMINRTQVAGIMIVAFAGISIFFAKGYFWILTIALAIVGTSLTLWGEFVSSRFDPNAGDSEARKTIGRNEAIWGEQLVDLLANNPNLGQPTMLARGEGSPI